MPKDFDEKIESRLNEIKVGFEKAVKEKEGLIKRRKDLVDSFNTQASQLDRRINELSAAQIDFGARYTELANLLPKDKQEKYLSTTPTPQKEKKKKPKETTVKEKRK